MLTSEQKSILLKYNEDLDTELADRVHDGIKDLLLLTGEDPDRDGLAETPFRVVKSMLEFTEGYREDPKVHLEKTFDVNSRELVIVKDIEFYSNCEHHLVPFFGVAHVGYIPDKKITGLSKIARMVDGYAKRFQVQERLTQEITEAMTEVLKPQGVMVVLEAKHMCICGRGIKKNDAETITSAVRGLFTHDAALRAEFLSLIKGGR